MRKGRAAVLRLYLAVALLAGAGLLLVSVSGAALVFRPELDDAVFGGPVRVAPGGGRAPLQALLDPGSARVLGSRWLERSPLHALRALHTELYLGGRGRLVVGALGLLLVLQGATGLFLWWPFTRRLPRGFTIRGGRRWRVVGYDLHKVIGIASLAFHVPVAFTGALLALSAGAGPARSGSVEVRERDGSVAWLDRGSGTVTVVRDPHRPGERPWALVAALHEGRFGGLAARWLYVAGGLTPVALALTGLGMWLGRPRPRPPLPSGERAG